MVRGTFFMARNLVGPKLLAKEVPEKEAAVRVKRLRESTADQGQEWGCCTNV